MVLNGSMFLRMLNGNQLFQGAASLPWSAQRRRGVFCGCLADVPSQFIDGVLVRYQEGWVGLRATTYTSSLVEPDLTNSSFGGNPRI